MVALHTPVELGRGFVSTSRLQEPPHSFVVAALRAFDLGGREGRQLVLFVADDLDRGNIRELLLRCLRHGLPCLVGISTVVT